MGKEMKKGFGIVEVMVSLVIVVIFLVAMNRIFMTTTRSGSYADNLTYATVLGHTKQLELKSPTIGEDAWGSGWHRDADNPQKQAGRPFYVFWEVKEQDEAKEVTVYCAWSDHKPAADFDSLEALLNSGCAYVTFQGLNSQN